MLHAAQNTCQLKLCVYVTTHVSSFFYLHRSDKRQRIGSARRGSGMRWSSLASGDGGAAGCTGQPFHLETAVQQECRMLRPLALLFLTLTLPRALRSSSSPQPREFSPILGRFRCRTGSSSRRWRWRLRSVWRCGWARRARSCGSSRCRWAPQAPALCVAARGGRAAEREYGFRHQGATADSNSARQSTPSSI
jgi:hypothetical protein